MVKRVAVQLRQSTHVLLIIFHGFEVCVLVHISATNRKIVSLLKLMQGGGSKQSHYCGQYISITPLLMLSTVSLKD